MDTDGALVIDLRKPDWAESADVMLREFAADPPKSILFEANDAAAPGAEEAQLILAFSRFAAAADIPVAMNGLADELTAGLERIGLPEIFAAAEGDSTP